MRIKICMLLLASLPATVSAQTLEECQEAASRNYPLIRQYDLISNTTELTVSNISKGWLPQVSLTAQATYQSDVTAFPDELQAIYQQAGIKMEGLKKDQYRVGIDINQTLFDGGSIKSQKETARAQGALETAQNDVTMYGIRQRVIEMYFGLLLMDEQIQLNNDLQALLSSSEKKLASMFKNGTAAECDYLSVKAERLHAEQQQSALQSQRDQLARMLSVFCGIEVSHPTLPQSTDLSSSSTDNNLLAFNKHPELRLADARLHLADVQEKSLNSLLMPRVSLFAQGYYGYPGMNLFEDMMGRQWSWNGLVGARLSWNIGALYTRKNDKAKIQQMREQAVNYRDVFLFNNQLEQMQYDEQTARYRQQMAADEEIVSLRSAVRKAAESKLAHGIIDVNALIKEINNENAARVQQSIHEIEMWKSFFIRELKGS